MSDDIREAVKIVEEMSEPLKLEEAKSIHDFFMQLLKKEKLKSCPFCGEIPEFSGLSTTIYLGCCVEMSFDISNYYTEEECKAWRDGTLKYSEDLENRIIYPAIAAWNRRADERNVFTFETWINSEEAKRNKPEHVSDGDYYHISRRAYFADSKQADGWLPIETAPKDKTKFMAFDPNWYDVPFPCYWLNGKWVFYCPGTNPIEMRPTHWMPLPAAPKGDELTISRN